MTSHFLPLAMVICRDGAPSCACPFLHVVDDHLGTHPLDSLCQACLCLAGDWLAWRSGLDRPLHDHFIGLDYWQGKSSWTRDTLAEEEEKEKKKLPRTY